MYMAKKASREARNLAAATFNDLTRQLATPAFNGVSEIRDDGSKEHYVHPGFASTLRVLANVSSFLDCDILVTVIPGTHGAFSRLRHEGPLRWGQTIPYE